MVEDTEGARIQKKNRSTVAAVEELFASFLIQPNMVQWDNLISAALLARLHLEWLNNSAASLAGWQGAINFANRETERLYRELRNFTYGNFFSDPQNSNTWFPLGYRGMVREFMGGERTWEYINTIENAGLSDTHLTPATLDLDEDAFYQHVKLQAANILRRGDPLNASVAPENVDDAIAKATVKASKKARSKRATRGREESADLRAEILSEEIPFVPAPMGAGRSRVTPQVLAEQVSNIGQYLLEYIPELTSMENTQQATQLITQIQREFEAQELVSEIANTYCTINAYLQEPNDDELYNATLDQLARLQNAAYGVEEGAIVDEDVEMADAPPLRGGPPPVEQPRGPPVEVPRKAAGPQVGRRPGSDDDVPNDEDVMDTRAAEPSKRAVEGENSGEDAPRRRRARAEVNGGSAMRVADETCSLQ